MSHLTLNLHQILSLLSQLLFYSDAFTKLCLQKCFIFKEIHRKDPDNYSRIKISETLKIIKLNWGKNFQNSDAKTELLTKDKELQRTE